MYHTRRLRLAALGVTLAAGPLALCVTPASAVTGGTAVSDSDTTYAYTAQLTVGDHDRGCSAALIDAEWLLTAASCFADDPAQSLSVPAGAPAMKTTAVIGRANLTGTQGAERRVVELVLRTDRDVVLARLDRPVTNVAPIALATSTPAAGEELKFAGYGRTKDEWAPLRLHTGTYTVNSADATSADVTGKDGAAACMGDTGGPVVRVTNGTHQLVALNSQSYQGGCLGTDAAQTSTGGITARVDDLTSWVDSKIGATPTSITDFNCDGVEDIAISNPKATVGSATTAGEIQVSYSGGTGTAHINQDLDWVTGSSEPNDWFGQTLATVDWDQDGCTDLVVGTPADDIGTTADAGMVDILHGAPGGLGTGTTKDTHFEEGQGTGAIGVSAVEADDRMGDSLAAGTTAADEPFLIIGVPGESIGSLAKAGDFYYLRGTTNVAVDQDSTNVPGTAEASDGFGDTLAADGNHFAVGSPGEAIGTDAGAGAVTVFDHTLNSEGRPTPRFGLDQDLATVSGDAEPSDQFGSALAMAPYRPSGAAAATESILAVGIWGEDLTIAGAAKSDAGAVLTFRIPSTGTFSQLNTYTQGTSTDDVTGDSETGDHFGWTVTAVNTAPRAVSTAATMRMAVGVPDETVGTASKAGAIQVFSLLDTPGANDKWLEPGNNAGIPGTPSANQGLGHSIHFTGTSLYVGMPDGENPDNQFSPSPLHSLPMANVIAGGTPTAISTYYQSDDWHPNRPGEDRGFGWTAR
ncbi:S1 family peptidase [Streptomyces sp. NPDC005813]|uniref:S1 family peptidase n=1 Tax=Streptomyces sp. NPDC005813 TaxID=3155592 RepID=UPI0033F56133